MMKRLAHVTTALLSLALFAHAASEAPQGSLQLLTSGLDGTYYILGQAIDRAVRDDGVELQVIPTKGSLDNLKRLKQGQQSLALVQEDVLVTSTGDFASQQDVPWRMLLALAEEPVQIVIGPQWADRVGSVRALSIAPIAIGWQEGGTHFTSSQVLKALDLSVDPQKARGQAGIVEANKHTEIMTKIQRGEAAAGFFVTNSPNPQVSFLLANPTYTLLSFTEEEQEKITIHYPYYREVNIPAGTYWHQNAAVATIAVNTVLVGHKNLPKAEVKEVLAAC